MSYMNQILFKIGKSTDIWAFFDPWNFCKNLRYRFRENGVQNFGNVAHSPVRPLGGLSSPTWPLEILGLETLMKMVLFGGGSPPIWARYGVWPVCSLAHFFSKFLPVILEISSWSIVPTAYYRFWNFKENLIHVTQINFVQSWEKREKSLFGVRKAKIFQVPRPLQWANVKILSRWSRNGAR